MQNSSWLVFSVIKNVEKIIDSKFDSNNIKYDSIKNKVNYQWFSRARKYSVDISKRIYNDIENHFYSYDDLIITLCYMYIFDKKVNLNSINKNYVKSTMKLFTKEELERNKKFILDVNKQVKLKNINEFFDIKDDGVSVVYHLIMDKNISPIFYVYFTNKNLTIKKENVILDEYKRFEKIMYLIIKTLFKPQEV
jgi:hypothetical protein